MAHVFIPNTWQVFSNTVSLWLLLSLLLLEKFSFESVGMRMRKALLGRVHFSGLPRPSDGTSGLLSFQPIQGRERRGSGWKPHCPCRTWLWSPAACPVATLFPWQSPGWGGKSMFRRSWRKISEPPSGSPPRNPFGFGSLRIKGTIPS